MLKSLWILSLVATTLFASPVLRAMEPIDLGEKILNARNFAQNELTRENCAAELEKMNSTTEKLTPQDVIMSRVTPDVENIIKDLFLTRLALADKLKIMSESGPVDRSCISNIRRSVRIIRALEEYLAHITIHNQTVAVMQGAEPYLMINPKYKGLELQSGDILLSRGDAVVSAAIARIGDDDSQFSHASIVYVDEASKKTYVIEAQVQTGTGVALFEETFMHDGKLRAAVYRQKNKELAKTAGRFAYDMATKALGAGLPIPYDFAMNLEDHKEVFCSEIPYAAYKQASGGLFVLGDQYRTTFNMKNKTWLRGIGVKVSSTFSPSDIEFDPKLELVAEWRDLARVQKANRTDAVMNRVFAWMEEGYNLDSSKFDTVAEIVHALRHTPGIGRMLENMIIWNMGVDTMKQVTAMHVTGTKIVDALTEYAIAREAKTGYPPTFSEMLAMLEDLRTQDQMRQKKLESWYRDNALVIPSLSDRPKAPLFMGYFTKRAI